MLDYHKKFFFLDFFDASFFQTSLILLIIFGAFLFWGKFFLKSLDSNKKNFIKNLFLSFFAGLCFSFGFEPFNNLIANFLCFFIIYMVFSKNHNIKNIIIYSLFFIISYVFFSLRWIYFAPFNCENFEIFAPFALILFIFYFLFYFLLFSVSFCKLTNFFSKIPGLNQYSLIWRPFLFSGLFIFCFEFLRSLGRFGFPWNLIGTIFLDYSFAIKLIQKFGIFIFGFFIILIFSFIFEIIINLIQKKFIQSLKSLILLFFLFCIIKISLYESQKNQCDLNPLTSSVYKNQFLKKPYIGIRLLSTNINQKQKWQKSLLNQHLMNNIKLGFEENSDDITYFIWPEASFPFFLEIDETGEILKENEFLPYLSSFLKDDQFLILGIILRQKQISGEFQFFNSIIILDKNSKIISFYSKKKLVPFGEFIPLLNLFNFKQLKKFNLISKGLESQECIKCSEAPKFQRKFFPLICFEGIFPFSKNQKRILEESDFILNISNDAWFDSKFAPKQFLRMIRARSIESSKPLLRAANKGFSGLIDKNGKILNLTNEDFNQNSFIDVYVK